MGTWDSQYVKGEWNAICDICGFQFKASELKENWKNQRVCKDDFEGKHPQMFVRAKPEKISTEWSRLPGSTEVWTGADFIGPVVNTIGAVGLASADATAGSVTLTLPTLTALQLLSLNRITVTRVDTSLTFTVTVNGLTVGPNSGIIFTTSNGTIWRLFGRVG